MQGRGQRGAGHGEHIAAALKMAVAQDAAAHDGQVGVAAAGVVGELLHEIHDLAQGAAIHLHGGVILVQDDAVLIEVDVGAVLEIPRLTAQLHRHDAVGLPRGEVDAPRVADVLPAEHTLGVGGLGLQLLQRDGLGVLLGLG